MAAEEKQLVLESTAPVSAVSTVLSSPKLFSENKKEDAIIAFNGAPARKIRGLIKLPQLTESTQTGYTKGPTTKTSVLCCQVGTQLLEKNTAYDFIMMANAAAQDGIILKINEGFRTMERQTQLYNERLNPSVSKKKGAAAPPGWSNHQSGIAVDIDVDMDPDAYRAKAYSAKYLWLAGDGTTPGHAADFGFDHVEGAKVDEPWHWTHLEKKIVGVAAFQNLTGYEILTADTALAASSLGQSGTQRSAYQAVHDHTVGLSRGASMQSTPRSAFLAEQSLFCANLSNGQSNLISQVESVTTLEAEPASFDAETLSAFSYNFDTGMWEDEKTV